MLAACSGASAILSRLLRDIRTTQCFFFSSRRRHTRCGRDWSSDVCSSDLLVTGRAAFLVDFKQQITSRLPYALALIALSTFVLLFLMTGSVLVPLKALVMNALSLGATFGALVWIFQDGHLSGLLGFESFGAVEVWVPIL